MAQLFFPKPVSARVAPLPRPKPKADWPLMCDLMTVRADIPEALIRWRKARGEPLSISPTSE